ncbi:MAG: hypothetical protein ACK4VV_00420 [Pseudomonas sp.]
MSSLLIGMLVGGGILLLLSIGFISQGLERARLERARQSADLNARIKVCQRVGAELPGQFMSPELKALLLGFEVHLLDKLLRIDRKDAQVQKRLNDVREQLKQPESAISNAPLRIDDPVKAKEVRVQLDDLRGILAQANKEGLLDNRGLQQWNQLLRQHIVETALSMFQMVAEQAMRENKPRVAKLQYERAIAYLQKLNSPDQAPRIASLKQLLAVATEATVRQERASTAASSELSAGLQELESGDDAWKKKAVYDD